MFKIIFIFIVVFIVSGCSTFNVDEISCKIVFDDEGNVTDSEECPKGYECNGKSCFESKCTDAKKLECAKNNSQMCQPSTGECISEDNYCYIDGKKKESSCGPNNNGYYICKNREWDTNNCFDYDVCKEYELEFDEGSCGENNNYKLAKNKCETGQWVPFNQCSDFCINGKTHKILCGYNNQGKQQEECIEGVWHSSSECEDPDVCADNSPDIISCGLNDRGTKERVCQNGQWGNFSECTDPDICVDDSINLTTNLCQINQNINGLFNGTCREGQWENMQCINQITSKFEHPQDESKDDVIYDMFTDENNIYALATVDTLLIDWEIYESDSQQYLGKIKILKYDNNLNVIKTVTENITDDCGKVAFSFDYDKTNKKIYIAGHFNGVCTINGNTITSENWDGFILIYDMTTDIFVKFHRFGTRNYEDTFGIKYYENKLYVVGSTAVEKGGLWNSRNATLRVFNIDNSTNILTELQGLYKEIGDLLHEQLFFAVDIDSNGNIYAAGRTLSSFSENTILGEGDIFITKFNSDLQEQWTKFYGTTKDDTLRDIKIDSSNNIFITGLTTGTMYSNQTKGDNDIFLLKINSENGIITKSTQWGTNKADRGYELFIDNNNDIYVTGYTDNGLDENIGTGNLCENGSRPCADIFVTKFDKNLNKKWTKQWGSQRDDNGLAITMDSDGNIFTGGASKGDIDNTNIGRLTWDTFISKISKELIDAIELQSNK